MYELLHSRWAHWFCIGSILLCTALYAYTGNYFFLGFPFAVCFLAGLVIDWKFCYWLLLFSIPASVQLFFLNDSLSTSVPDEPMMWAFLLVTIALLLTRSRTIPAWWWRNPIAVILVLQYLWLIIAVIFSHELVFSLKFLAAKSWFLASFVILPIWIFQTKKDYKKAFLLMLIPLVATMLIINARHALLNFSFRKVEKAIGDLYYN
ncbi:MAG: hypothetical protein EOP49_08140, partial [Sphingobacteriales bacterium]